MKTRRWVFKGELRELDNSESFPVAGTMFFKIDTDQAGMSILGYTGNLLAFGFTIAGEEFRLSVDNDFIGRVRITRVDTAGDGRAHLMAFASVGKPENQPPDVDKNA